MIRIDFRSARLIVVAIAAWSGGCASLTNPVGDGIPVRRLPTELFPAPREEMKPIPLTLLRQEKPEVYRLAAGDILGIYIETLLGDKSGVPPVRMSDNANLPPALGFPIPVQENGTISLPFTDPIPVVGMSIEEAREAIRVAIVEKKQLVPKERARIFVTLMQPRRYHIIVVRQDTGSSSGTNTAVAIDPTSGSIKRGSGFPIDLPAYENDVLNALARTGGLPGLDANNEIVIQRSPSKAAPNDLTAQVGTTVRIPLRARPGEPLTFRPEDVILQTGDIIYIESRDTEIFYTAGLIPPGEYVLPRDHDLDVVEAVARVHGPLANGAFNQNNQFSGSLVNSGIGSPSPSLLTVLRKTANGRQIKIRVDLNVAMRDPRERILVQPGDILVLQEKPSEAIVRYITNVLHLNVDSNIIRGPNITGTGTLSVP